VRDSSHRKRLCRPRQSVSTKALLPLLLLAVSLSNASAWAREESPQPERSGQAGNREAPDRAIPATGGSAKESSDVPGSENHKASDSESEPVKKRGKSFTWEFHWDEGLHYRKERRLKPLEWLEERQKPGSETSIPRAPTPDYRLKGKIGAKLQVDAAAFSEHGDLEGFSDGIEVRRFRLYTKGDFFLLLPIYYDLDFGITKNKFHLNDFYLRIKDVPVLQTLQFGHFTAPFSLESFESSRDITFMEAGSPVEAFAPGHKVGIQAAGTELRDRLTWALGWFADGVGEDLGDVTDSLVRIVGRVTGLPLYENDVTTNRLLHVGLSASYVNASDNNVQYGSRPESHLAPRVVDTGGITARDAVLVGAEAAYVRGPLSFQGEYIHSFVDQEEGSRLQFKGFYAYLSYFPTGETRPYDTTEGIFGRVRPKRNFSFKNRVYGGCEIAARFSHLDLNDGDIQGGRMNIATAGLTWYLMAILRVKFNYQYADVHDTDQDGRVHIFQARFEIDL
jgi:phosphate-selective porin OprO/OprP